MFDVFSLFPCEPLLLNLRFHNAGIYLADISNGFTLRFFNIFAKYLPVICHRENAMGAFNRSMQ